MMNAEEIMNSGKLYKVMELTDEQGHYYEYLQKMEEYNAAGYGCNEPVHIGKNVWIASNVTVLPGVHIGDNSVIGAGSVVTRDIPENVLAVGNPARVLREINADDDIYYNHGKLISENLI